ncbi:MAG: FAD-binding protein [Erysipelotrichaceae bacterium]|nr:FAD-binding protein [Erysipelotrichaceae bacterium]
MTFTDSAIESIVVAEHKEAAGIASSENLTSPVGFLWMRGHNFETKQGVFDEAVTYIENNGGEVMVETKAEHLIVEDGAVRGVECTKTDGSRVTLHAGSVVITTGGFGANAEMVKEYNTYWPAIPEGIMATCVSAATGDGINLGLEAGANLVDMGLMQLMTTASACVPSCRSDHLNLLCEKRGNPFFLMKKTAFRQSSDM